MNNSKIENLLNLAMDVTETELEQSPELASGVDLNTDRWEVIVRYFGSLEMMRQEHPNWQITELLGGYGIIVLPKADIDILAGYSQVEYIEKPKPLYFETVQGRRASCFTAVQTGRGEVGSATNLTGAGVLVAVIDSGIDYRHPDFCWEDGSSRIVALFDLSTGIEYSKERMNEALREPTVEAARRIVPVTDISGHGTHVNSLKHKKYKEIKQVNTKRYQPQIGLFFCAKILQNFWNLPYISSLLLKFILEKFRISLGFCLDFIDRPYSAFGALRSPDHEHGLDEFKQVASRRCIKKIRNSKQMQTYVS